MKKSEYCKKLRRLIDGKEQLRGTKTELLIKEGSYQFVKGEISGLNIALNLLQTD